MSSRGRFGGLGRGRLRGGCGGRGLGKGLVGMDEVTFLLVLKGVGMER